MPYYDRLKIASYESPSGKEIEFSFEETNRTVTHRIGSFEFSGVDGTLHQDKGIGGEVYPLSVFIHGPEYDIVVDEFFDILKEIGPGFLNHPRWGRKRVQIISDIEQAENLVDQGGQSIINVTFQETLEREFPKTATTSQQEITSIADESYDDIMENFADQVDTENLADEQSFAQEMLAGAKKVKDKLENLASATSEVSAQFRQSIDNITNNVNDYVQAPFDFAFNITSAIRVVAEVPGRISARVEGFQNLFNVLKLRDITEASNQNKNAILIDEIISTAGLISVSEGLNQAFNNTSTISRDANGKASITTPGAETGYQSRAEVLSAVVYLQDNYIDQGDMLDTVQLIFENNILNESYIQSALSYISAWKVLSIVVKAGLDLSFSLPIRRVVVLDTDKTILELCYEFYKNIDDITLDFAIQTNGLTGNNILAVSRGEGFIYYA